MVSTHHLLRLITLAFCSSKVLADTPANQTYQVALDQHNEYRRDVNPSAANMLEMTWDDGLADEAQKWADNCKFAYIPKDQPHHYDFVGQNLYVSDQLEDIVQNAMEAWCTKEREVFNEDPSCIHSKVKRCNHYAKVIWSKSYKLGMGVSSRLCPSGKYMVVANYAKGRDYSEEYAYDAGTSASKCPAGSRAGSNDLCEVTDETKLMQAIGLKETD